MEGMRVLGGMWVGGGEKVSVRGVDVDEKYVSRDTHYPTDNHSARISYSYVHPHTWCIMPLSVLMQHSAY